MRTLITLALALSLSQSGLAANQLDLLQPATPTQQGSDAAAEGAYQTGNQQQIQQTPDQGEVLKLIEGDLDSAEDQAGFNWTKWTFWLISALAAGLIIGWRHFTTKA